MTTRTVGLYVLMATGIVAIIAIIFVAIMIMVTEGQSNSSGGTTGNTGTTGFICSGPGTPQHASPPKYSRKSPKSSCKTPLSTQTPPFTTINHPVQKLYRTRSLKGPISPNHWIANAMYGYENFFSVYPYIGSIQDTGFEFSWPSPGVLSQQCNGTGTCPTGYADLSYNVGFGSSIIIGSIGSNTLSCDILDFDALTATVAWQYSNPVTGKTGSITLPLAKGSPYITIEVVNTAVSMDCNFAVNLTSYNDFIYLINLENNQGYAIFLPKITTITHENNIITIPRITGAIRIAYYDSSLMLDTLLQDYTVYPIESTITSTNTTTTLFTWTTKNMLESSFDTELLMLALPHHNITNVTYSGITGSHPIIGPYQFVITKDNTWNLNYTVPDPIFAYPPISNPGQIKPVWEQEIDYLLDLPPSTTVDWCRWLGSIAIMLLIGDMLGENINSELTFLENQLSLIQTNRGAVSTYNTLVRDTTWGGVISNMGLMDCQGISDEGNSFYQNHIAQYGYLVFAYAVAGYFDPTFLSANQQTALYFVRNIANPCSADTIFPLWRNKDWYFGYSLSSGLTPGQSAGKDTYDIGEIILGYYGVYLFSSLINNTELNTWSASMLGMELASLQTYFQLPLADPAFVQGTITNRGDTFYQYTTTSGNTTFPQRNASIMISMIKPLTLLSNNYINPQWAIATRPWMTTAVTGGIQPESLGYAESLIIVENTPEIKQNAINTIIENSSTPLPYGSTWSSMLYWISQTI